ncbi:MAG: ScyD/ScyE family protein [Thermomicrobiales bacterium]
MPRSLLLVVTLLALLFSPTAAQEATPRVAPAASSLTTVASGLITPRGFLWTADGTLYVAQAGSGGQALGTPTAPPPVGPFLGGATASVVRIDNGCPVLVAGGLPSTSDQIGGILGVEDLAILGGQLYASIDGGGEAHGNASQPSGVYRILENGDAELVADLSAWVRANPVAHIPPDFDPDAAGYSLVADEATGTLWVSNPNSGEILNVGLDGSVTRVADLSAGHLVPTMLAAAPQGGVYVGFLTAVPFPDGAAKVSHVAADGTVTDVWTGLTTVTDVAVGPDGALYAVELSTGNLEEPPFMVPGSGRIVRQTGPESGEDVATGLMFPITLNVGPDGELYVALPAMGAAGGSGVIARIDSQGTPAGAADEPVCTPVSAATPVT